MRGFLGLVFIIVVAWLFSENKRTPPWRIIVSGLALQFTIALLMLKAPGFEQIFLWLNNLVHALEDATRAGTSFVFGYIGGGPLPFSENAPGASFVLAFQALPLVLIVGALTSLLYYWRILPIVVRGFSFLLRRTMGIGGALGVGTAANIFLGMIEAPLLIKPYLKELTRSELFALMTVGMTCIAGTMLVLYASVLEPIIPNSMGQILTASVISAPAALLIAGVFVPENAVTTQGDVLPASPAQGPMDAIANGTWDGFQLFLNIIAMLIVFVALVKLANMLLAFAPDIAGGPITLERIFGFVLSPVVWLIGIPWAESQTAGSLMGTKIVLNEFIAYQDMANLPPEALGMKSRLIMTYAMCGFANFGSLGILIGGLGYLCPGRRHEIAELGMRSVLAGVLACLSTGAIVGIIL
ncbi:NupC/NupG family nucleoside CNT transporter [Desulfovibrio inopinatus]|uniref:NupC/NupG family nucleoside CNT transporter n=1 Tax=Desulfovibrio inopinatus TaxID=102109 RepID=UPI0003F91DC0|nr:nucleoside transporter C-terminal domain-containing protein [Desulfovibrio inopinatus]